MLTPIHHDWSKMCHSFHMKINVGHQNVLNIFFPFLNRDFFCLRAKPTYVCQSVCVVLCSSWERKKNRQIVRPLFSFVPHLKLYHQILNILAKNFHFEASKCQKFQCKVISQLSSVILIVLKISGYFIVVDLSNSDSLYTS